MVVGRLTSNIAHEESGGRFSTLALLGLQCGSTH